MLLSYVISVTKIVRPVTHGVLRDRGGALVRGARGTAIVPELAPGPGIGW